MKQQTQTACVSPTDRWGVGDNDSEVTALCSGVYGEGPEPHDAQPDPGVHRVQVGLPGQEAGEAPEVFHTHADGSPLRSPVQRRF